MLTINLLKSEVLVPYDQALEFMQGRVKKIIKGEEEQLIWFLEHPSLYTAGTSANENELLDKKALPVYYVGRGGKYTYHGPGQRVVYTMLDIRKLHNGTPDLKKFINQIEEWIINTLGAFGVKGERRQGRIGIWVVGKDGKEVKIAALGIRVEKWVSYHGVAINVHPDMSHYQGIVPCGLKDYKASSFKEMGKEISLKELDQALIVNFCKTFGVSVRDA